MTYLQILNTIKDTALAQPNVNSVVREFLDLNREDAKYSAVVIQDRDGSRDRIEEQDYITYTWHLGYVDRLTYDESNRDDIISTGINIINNIVNTIRNTWFPELEVSLSDRINTFDQRFTAQCAGVYGVLSVNALVSDCIDSESGDIYDTFDAKITENGVYHFVPTGRPVDEINITVDVAGSGKEEVSLTDTLTMNGTHTYIPAEDTVYKDVELTVDVHPTERLVQTYTTNGVKSITGEFNGGEITVDVNTDAVWGSITGNITDQTDLVDYVAGKDNEIKTWVEAIIINKEDKKPVFYIDVDFDGPSVLTSYNDYLTIGAQIKQLGADNVVLYVRDRSGYICMPDVIEAVSQNYMTITGMAYSNYYRISNDSSSLFIYFNSFVGYNQLENNINGVKTWVVNQNYAKKTELKTINGQSIVGSGDITIQATGGVTEEWLQNNLKTINGESLIGGGDLAVQSPIEIGIDIDSGQLIGITYDEYKAMIDEYANDGGYTKKLMIYLGSETAGREYSSYPSDVEYCPDGIIEIGGYFLDDRDENNKKLVYYRIKGNDATQKIELTLTPIPSNADIPDLTGYATESWVTNQGYTTQTYVDDKIGQIDTLLDQMLG